MNIGLVYSIIRTDEKLLIKAAEKLGIKIKLIGLEKTVLNPDTYQVNFDVILIRSVSSVMGLEAAKFFESLDIPVINNSVVASICENKFATSLILKKFKVPTLKFAMVFDLPQAFEAVKQLGGFPVVIKPIHGSWGRLVTKINDKDSLEAVLEHKHVLGSPYHKVYYIEEYIEKPGRDIRAFVINGKAVAAIYRNSFHWITNTARGSQVSNCPINNNLADICQQASEAVGGGVLAMDIFETKEGLKVNEINHTMEFKNSEEPTGVSISGLIMKYCKEVVYV